MRCLHFVGVVLILRKQSSFNGSRDCQPLASFGDQPSVRQSNLVLDQLQLPEFGRPDSEATAVGRPLAFIICVHRIYFQIERDAQCQSASKTF